MFYTSYPTLELKQPLPQRLTKMKTNGYYIVAELGINVKKLSNAMDTRLNIDTVFVCTNQNRPHQKL